MREIYRLALQITGMVAAVLSLVSLYWWCLLVMIASPTYIRVGSLIDDLLRFYFFWGGSLGWVSLAALIFLQYRPIRNPPRWIVVGIIIGISVATSMIVRDSSIWVFAISPIIAGSALLVHGFTAPNSPLNADAPTGGTPVS